MFKSPQARLMRGSISAALAAAIAFITVGACIGGVASWRFMSEKVQVAEQTARDAAKTLGVERELRALSDTNAEAVAKRLVTQEEKTRALQTKLSVALAKSPDCSLSADAGRVLRDVVPEAGAAAPSAQPEARPDPADTAAADRARDGVEIDGRVVSCKAVAEWAARNIGIAQDDAVRHQGVIDQYEIVRSRSVSQ